MIEYLKIENFGPILGESEVNFEVAEGTEEDAYEVKMPDGKKLIKLAYIYGANASGKTTVLQAFEFLRKMWLQPVQDKAGELDFDPFLFRAKAYTHPSRLELAFYVDGIRYVYEVNFNKESILAEKVLLYQTAKPKELFSRTTDGEKRLAKIQFGSSIKVPAREKDLLESNTLHNNTVLGAFAKTNVDIPELEQLNKWASRFLLGMVTGANDITEITAAQIDQNPAMIVWINSFLNKADSQITEVQVADASMQLPLPWQNGDIDLTFRLTAQGSYTKKTTLKGRSGVIYGGGPSQRKIDFVHRVVEGNKKWTLSILKESSGTKRYFGLGGPLYALIHGSHLLCIDELETSLHPDLMKHFLQTFLLNSTRSQLLITTHNTALMEEQDFIRRDALWFSEKQGDGSVQLYSAADFDSTALRKDASLINAYRSGRLGAKPNLGSPYLIEK
jgi:AAA15 family ATPase/GTPase